ncbi:SMI1/KNR4 family protein [Bremerella cremea]|uniref:SMI1/KNR4 family protein n=1 Tax=Bremerella cremea TaxID=1031537 RepID=UPI0031E8462E
MQSMIERVRAHLSTLGITLQFEANPPATQADVDEAQERLQLSLPASYVSFVTQFANGFDLAWTSPKDKVFGTFTMEPIASSVEGLLGMRDWRLYSEKAARQYGFPYTDDPELAMRTNARMHHWLPLVRIANGDFLSIDLNEDHFGQAIFDKHDWLDGGSGDNGSPLADDWPTFFEAWSRVCFVHPKSYYWPNILQDTGVEWSSPEFLNRFRLGKDSIR